MKTTLWELPTNESCRCAMTCDTLGYPSVNLPYVLIHKHKTHSHERCGWTSIEAFNRRVTLHSCCQFLSLVRSWLHVILPTFTLGASQASCLAILTRVLFCDSHLLSNYSLPFSSRGCCSAFSVFSSLQICATWSASWRNRGASSRSWVLI